jgi:hypothetical protein
MTDKLDKPAQVGATVFRKGVAISTVVKAAQRFYEKTHAEKTTSEEVYGVGDHEFVGDWYRPSSCMLCSFKRDHPVHNSKT